MELDPFDRTFEERMFSSHLAAGDLPPGYSSVAMILKRAAIASPAPDRTLADRTVAAMVTAIGAAASTAAAPSAPTDRAVRRSLLPRRVAVRTAVLAFAMLVLGGGMAFAGVLPSPLQSAAAGIARHLGVTLPTGGDSSAGKPANAHGGGQQTKVPPTQSLPGLCTAYLAGNGGTNGRKDASTAFTRLQAAATADGKSVVDYCRENGTHHGQGHDKSPGSHGESTEHNGGGAQKEHGHQRDGSLLGEKGSSSRGGRDKSTGGSHGSHANTGGTGGSQDQGTSHP